MKKGFTLIELLVVIAIIGILSGVVLTSLGTARNKGSDAAVKGDLDGIRSEAEIYYDSNGGYGTSANCSGGMFTGDTKIQSAVNAAKSAGSGTASCVGIGTAWGVAVNLKTSSTTYWCVDSNGSATSTTNATPVNATTALCQ